MWQDNLKKWQQVKDLDPILKKELSKISDQSQSELEESFGDFAVFGTGGIRAKLGVGHAKLNFYTIARATSGLADYIKKQDLARPSIVIGYDTRYFSREFAVLSANILAAHQIQVYLTDHVIPTPELSFLVRHFKANNGIMITASHNPAMYNGYKVYDSDGGQITLNMANQIIDEIQKYDDDLFALPINYQEIENPLITSLDEEIEQLYLEKLQTVARNKSMINGEGSKLKIVYTPLHGTGERLVKKGLASLGFTDVSIVTEQAVKDPNFSTVEFPNPEFPEAFNLAMKLGKKQGADILIATDPDADRLGVAIKDDDGQYTLLTGNQMGALMIDYLLQSLTSSDLSKYDYQVVKTIVTSDLGAKIARSHGCNVRETLTGFKFIGEQIEQIELAHDKTKYLFGYEESYGYLIEPYVRDKDAIQAAILTAEMALSAKMAHKSLLKRLQELYKNFGYYDERLLTKTFSSSLEAQLLEHRITELRQNPPKVIGTMKVVKFEDFENSLAFNNRGETNLIELPKSNVLKFILENGSWLAVRPSGTEPKIKVYLSAVGKTAVESENLLEQLEDFSNRKLLI